MAYSKALDPLVTENARNAATARNWYTLEANDIGEKELPRGYGRALRVRMSSAASVPLTLVVVPVGEANDAVTRTLLVDYSEYLPMSVRRIVSVNGGTAIPSGVAIDVVTA